MYDAFYGFREKPFSLLPDPDYLYLSPQHEKALGLLELSLHNQAGFCVISGEIGAGKTTLIRKLLTLAGGEFRVGLVSNTLDSFGDLMNWILLAFELRGGGSPVEQHERFIDFLIQQYGRGRRTVLIIDEAQNLGVDALEELRMLSNVNADKHQVLQVILVGQAGLRETLRRPELAQFAQRVLMDFHLGPLGREDTARYIRHRVLVAGADPQLFSEEAAAALFRYSGGIPRIINLLCDTALVYGYAEGRPAIGEELIHAVARERQSSSAAPALRLAAVAPPVPAPVQNIRGLGVLPAAMAPRGMESLAPATAPELAAEPAAQAAAVEEPQEPVRMAADAGETSERELDQVSQAAQAAEEAQPSAAPVAGEDDDEWLRRLAERAVPPALRGAAPQPQESPAIVVPEQQPPPPIVPARQPQAASRRGGRAAGLVALLVAGAGAYWFWSGGDPVAGPAGPASTAAAEQASEPVPETATQAPPANFLHGTGFPEAAIARPEQEVQAAPQRATEPPPAPSLPVEPAVVAPAVTEGPVEPSPEPAPPPPGIAAPQAPPARVTTREPKREVASPPPAPRPAARSAPVPRAAPAVVVSAPAPEATAPEATAPAPRPDPEPALPVAVIAPQPTPQPAREALSEVQPSAAAAREEDPVPMAVEPQSFTTDPCRGPAARYLSTCR